MFRLGDSETTVSKMLKTTALCVRASLAALDHGFMLSLLCMFVGLQYICVSNTTVKWPNIKDYGGHLQRNSKMLGDTNFL